MGFNDQAVARKSSITMLNVKHLLEWLHAATGLWSSDTLVIFSVLNHILLSGSGSWMTVWGCL